MKTGSFQNLLGNHRSARPHAPPLTDAEQKKGDRALRWPPLSLVEVWWVCLFELWFLFFLDRKLVSPVKFLVL